MNRIITALFALLTLFGGTACSQSDSSRSVTNDHKTILVAGATGTQGGAVARELLSRGYIVRGLTRNPDSVKAKALGDLGAIMVKGNFDDPASLAAALDGVYGVFVVTTAHNAETEIAQGRQFIEAAKAANVQHFVYTSVAKAETNTGVPHFDSKYEVEKILYDSELNYSVVRPVEFMDNLHKYWRAQIEAGSWPDPRPVTRRHQWIAAKDIGFFVGEAFDKPDEWLGKALNIAGEEMTLAEFIETLSDELGIEIKYRKISWEEFMAGNGKEMTAMYRWFDNPGYQVDIDTLRSRYPNLSTWKDFFLDSKTRPEQPIQ